MTPRHLMLVFAGLLPLAASAESFRCGKWIIDENITLDELVQKCGTPTTVESRTEDIKVRNRNNGLMIKTGETTTEIWTYDRGPQAMPMVVTIVDGRIRSVQRAKP